MVHRKNFRVIALEFEEAYEDAHFDKVAFKVKGKIFATLNLEHFRACVKLSRIDQDVFCSFNNEIMYPVPNAWGKQGWTLIDLQKIKKEMCRDAVRRAYCSVAPAKLAVKYSDEEV